MLCFVDKADVKELERIKACVIALFSFASDDRVGRNVFVRAWESCAGTHEDLYVLVSRRLSAVASPDSFWVSSSVCWEETEFGVRGGVLRAREDSTFREIFCAMKARVGNWPGTPAGHLT